MIASFLTHYELSSTITQLLSKELKIAEDLVQRNMPMTQYGLDSIAALTIAGELEDKFDIVLPSTLLWDCPTVDALAVYLRDTLSARSAGVPA